MDSESSRTRGSVWGLAAQDVGSFALKRSAEDRRCRQWELESGIGNWDGMGYRSRLASLLEAAAVERLGP